MQAHLVLLCVILKQVQYLLVLINVLLVFSVGKGRDLSRKIMDIFYPLITKRPSMGGYWGKNKRGKRRKLVIGVYKKGRNRRKEEQEFNEDKGE